MQSHLTRRGFLGSALAITAAGIAPSAFPQAALKTRLDWKTFRKGRDYSSFCDAIRRMKANTTPGDPRSWAYWTQIHATWCPHHDPYFMAWHRGYLAFFERQLRAVSGNPRLTLPYWDYYQDPVVPTEFTDPAPWNPLYTGRVNTNVASALTVPAGGVDPFSSTVTTFQGSSSAFEQVLESRPHDPVHDLIGNAMAGMQSPVDPIFWLHHANVDRLLNAWVAAGGGRTMPPSTDAYWNGRLVDTNSRDWLGVFKYSDSTVLPARFSLPVRSTIDSRTNFGYFYDNEKLPSGSPAAAIAPTTSLLAASSTSTSVAGGSATTSVVAGRASASVAPARAVPMGKFATSGMRQTASKRLALGGVLSVALSRQSVGAEIALPSRATRLLRTVLDSYQASPFAGVAAAGTALPYTSVKVVLADVSMMNSGADGGYFYNLNLYLPSTQGGKSEDVYPFGNVGPFRVAGRQHHAHTSMAVTLEFDITELLLKRGRPSLDTHRFTLDRVSGANAPDGEVIHIGEVRLELA